MWSWLAIAFAILLGVGGIFGAGFHYGQTVERNATLTADVADRDRVIAKQNAELTEREDDVSQAQADMLAIQSDLSTIKQRTSSVGAQVRSAFDASGMGVCVLSDDAQRVRAEGYERARSAVTAANRARGNP